MTGNPPPEEVVLSSLSLRNIRNILSLEADIPPGILVLAGANAQGKTTLLESVATLLLAKSPRTGTLSELMTWNSENSRIAGTLDAGPRGTDRVEMLLAADGIRKRMLLNGSPSSPRDVLKKVPVIWFTPETMELVAGGPDGRRTLLDQIASQAVPGALESLLAYRKILAHRNSLLKASTFDQAVFESFSASLASSAAAIVAFRSSLVADIGRAFEEAFADAFPLDGTVSLAYAPSLPSDVSLAQELLFRHVDKDRLAKTTTLGPHRDDIAILIGGREARRGASQGQRRSIVLSLLLGLIPVFSARTGIRPLVLLDDVLSELDGSRRAALAHALGAGSVACQSLITCTDADTIPTTLRKRASLWRVESGTIVAG